MVGRWTKSVMDSMDPIEFAMAVLHERKSHAGPTPLNIKLEEARQELEKLRNELRNNEGFFPITSIHREDIVEKFGEEARNIDDGQMYYIAKKMGDDYTNQLFWDSMEIIVENVTGLKPKAGND